MSKPIFVVVAAATIVGCGDNVPTTIDAAPASPDDPGDPGPIAHSLCPLPPPPPEVCHDIKDFINAEVRPGDDEARWVFDVPKGRCVAAICLWPDPDESTVLIAPWMERADGRRVELVQTLGVEGTPVQEWCAEWRSLRYHTDLGGAESHELTVRGRTYLPIVTIRY